MRERFTLDVYNVIIAALIPFILVTAWGLTTVYERNERARHCEQSLTYLEDAADISSLFTSAETIDDADQWLQEMEQLSDPAPASALHNGAISAYSYAATVQLQVPMSEPAGLYSELSAFQDVLDEGRETLVTQCPATEPMITDAFPMYFRDEE